MKNELATVYELPCSHSYTMYGSADLLSIAEEAALSEEDVAYPELVHESAAILALRVVFFQACLAIAAVVVNAEFINTIDISAGTGLLSFALDATIVVLLVLDTAFITGLVIQWAHRRYVITPDEVVVDSGTAQIQRRVYKTDDLKSVELHQSLMGKLFNYGTISFYSPVFKKGVQLTNLPNPQRYLEILAGDRLPDGTTQSGTVL